MSAWEKWVAFRTIFGNTNLNPGYAMKKIVILFIIIVTGSLSGCEKWKLPEANFLQLEIVAIEPVSLTSLDISGEIRGLRFGEISDHGFVWTDRQEIPSILLNEKESFGIMGNEDNPFLSATISNLLPNTSYIFAVYAQTDEAIFYSDTLHYTTGTGSVTTDSLRYIPRTTNIELSGTFSGAEAGIIAVQHGFCWSTTHAAPDLEDSHSLSGNLETNHPFTFTFKRLLRNTPFYFRAYAIIQYPQTIKKDTIYGSTLFFDGKLDDWIQKAVFPGTGIENLVAFSIGDKGYMGTGYDRLNMVYAGDFWEYDPATDQWTQKTDFGGGARTAAIGFSIGNRGYIGRGARGSIGEWYDDFWEYDPIEDKWARKADLPGGTGGSAVAFSIGDKGYIYIHTQYQTFWEYDQLTDQWAPKADLPGGDRWNAVGFSIGDKGYIGTGYDGEFYNDFWEYDPATGQWNRKADFPGGARDRAVGFSAGNKGYIGTGWNQGSDFWEYDPAIDEWSRITDIPGGSREKAVGFSIGNSGYVARGFLKDDFWEYQ